MVVAWTGLSISTPQQSSLSGVPRRLFSPLPWDTASLHPLDCHQASRHLAENIYFLHQLQDKEMSLQHTSLLLLILLLIE
ncbi:hypothetical protein NC652_004820 [Populus alba x Populus x berolinensis]|nr:hypothetical protein NC652_004820 [Populus alba x Populus x berolinensis]